jgi:uracil-DNA glycosylase family 4
LTSELSKIAQRVTQCTACPRLVRWRNEVAKTKTKRFNDETYWGKPVPGFGDSQAQILIIGLAPAAHGANRTGRMFTGDRSGDWLYRALHKAGLANQAQSTSRDDGLQLSGCYITAICRCAPPANKPTAEEIQICAPFLIDEIKYFQKLWETSQKNGVIVCLGQLAFTQTLRLLEQLKIFTAKPRPKFGHGKIFTLTPNLTLITSYHPSQQNTFTGKLTEPMFDSIFESAVKIIKA